MKKYHKIGIFVFLGALVLGGIIALIIPLRPTVSELEKRNLAKFPKFTVESFVNGEWFSDVSTWYSDTFPGREVLVGAASGMDKLYGIQGEEQLIVNNGGNTGDDIPEVGETAGTVPEEPEEPDTEPDETQGENSGEGESQEEPEESDESTNTGGTINQIQEQFGAVYIADNRAFSLFYFNREAADTYINAVNAMAKKLPDNIKVYDILAPTSAEFYLSQDVIKSLGANGEKAAFDYMYAAMDDEVITVDIYDAIGSHKDEYIYFKTDHHWTSLGAYYAYREFAEAKGWDAPELSEYESITFEGFLGSYYAGSEQSPILKANPDYVTAYYPKGTNTMKILDWNYELWFNWDIIHDVGSNTGRNTYVCFIGGDYPIQEIHNPEITDGSACLVLKESYANAMIPFLVDHYQDIYVVDYRYFQGDVYQMINDYGVDDVIFLNNAEAAASGAEAMRMLYNIVK